jgi:hypothetical protein
MACEKCADLCLEYEIRSPADLRKAFAVARDNIADNTIQLASGSGSYWSFAKAIAEKGPWPDDTLFCQFACRSCGELFNLSADTYHGGGQWRQASVDDQWKARVIGDAPTMPDHSTLTAWFNRYRIGILVAAGLIMGLLLSLIFLRP